MNGDEARELEAAVLAEGVEIGLVLEEVGVKLLVVEREVRLNVVGELDHLERDALLLELRGDEIQNVRVRNGARTDREGLGVAALGSIVVTAAGKTEGAGSHAHRSKKLEFHD